jgi:hypothetical protein
LYPAPQKNTASGSDLCRKEMPVDVLSGGKWYPAKILDGPDKMGTCLVTYDGYGSHFDEWVNVQRIRARSTGTNASVQAAPKARANADSVRTGKYACYTFDGGQLNYTYTDVIIEPHNRYSINGGKGGSYTIAPDGSMTFTGPLSNASGRHSIRNTGKAQIDLVFNRDARASMSCAE